MTSKYIDLKLMSLIKNSLISEKPVTLCRLQQITGTVPLLVPQR
ncbi:MAG: hypothetical protein PHH93_06735 [Prolixibacteraceae bacterium]|nr:hypothetical protein [Prolixibacteraceae bacterium]